jgi:hypothetical protein
LAEHYPNPNAPDPDVIAQWQRDVVGVAMRLHCPLRNQADLRRVSQILRDFANRLEILSQVKVGDTPQDREFSALVQANMERKAAQNRLQSKPLAR